jgi:hypothetical protein
MKGSIFQAMTAAAALVLTAWTSGARADDPAIPRPTLPLEPTQSVVVAPTRDVIVTEEKVPNTGLITSGVLMFGIPYGISVAAAATSERSADSRLFLPVVGPWMDLAARGNDVGLRSGDTGNKVLLIADGIFQGLGVLQIIGGFVFPTTRVVTQSATIQVAPTVGSSLVGIGAVGQF